jgi:PKD domain
MVAPNRWRGNSQVVAPGEAFPVHLVPFNRRGEALARTVAALPPGTPVVLSSSAPWAAGRCRRFATRAEIDIQRAYLALPSARAPAYIVEDAPASVATFVRTALVVPPRTILSTGTQPYADRGSPAGPRVGATATHTYTTVGTFPVSVTVTDAAGNPAAANVSRRDPDPIPGGHSGGWAAQLANTAATAANCTLNDSPNWVKTTSAGTYAASKWVTADTPGATLKLRLWEYNGTVLVATATSQVTLSTSWQQVKVRYVPVSSGVSTLDFNASSPISPTALASRLTTRRSC